jgi:hypothetical protein
MEQQPAGQGKSRLFMLTCVGLLAIVLHFFLTTVYNLRYWARPALKNVSDCYTFPVFHQDMKLFAPDLAMYSVHLESRIYNNGQWQSWTDVTQKAGHDMRSRMERVEQNFNHALSWEVTQNLYSKDGVPQFDRLITSAAYRNALYYAWRMQSRFNGSEPYDSIQIRLNYAFTPPVGQQGEVNYSQLAFPPYSKHQMTR